MALEIIYCQLNCNRVDYLKYDQAGDSWFAGLARQNLGDWSLRGPESPAQSWTMRARFADNWNSRQWAVAVVAVER